MKKTVVFLIFLVSLLLQGPVQANSKGNIIIYGSKDCGFCQGMMKNLNAEKIPYKFHDVNKDATKNNEMWSKLSKEFGKMKSVKFPVMDIKGKILIRPDFKKVKSMIH